MHSQCIMHTDWRFGHSDNILGKHMTKITLKDRPCGWGKTTELINTLTHQDRYIIVVPLLSETVRIQEAAGKRGIEFHRPGYEGSTEIAGTKGEHLRELMQNRKNIVCTHELIYRIGTLSYLTQARIHGPISLL
ncbi:MAG: hypothetical protein KDK65_07005, partial [Chlamydiia bacterium]|nr:hypothetical protein [Chlamydiia bacterium]